MHLNPQTVDHFVQQISRCGCITLELPAKTGRFVVGHPDVSGCLDATEAGQISANWVSVTVAETQAGHYVLLVPQELQACDCMLAPLFAGEETVQGWRVLHLPRYTEAAAALGGAVEFAAGDVTALTRQRSGTNAPQDPTSAARPVEAAPAVAPTDTPPTGALPTDALPGRLETQRTSRDEDLFGHDAESADEGEPIGKSQSADGAIAALDDGAPARARVRVPGERAKNTSAADDLPFTRNLTMAAQRGELAEIAGRESELEQVVTVLLQRERSSPLLCGEPGVGKTAIVEKLAWLTAHRSTPEMCLPPRLYDAQVFALDVTALLADSAHKGSVERNLQRLLQKLDRQPSWILFADEIHTLTDARGDLSMAEMLKPRLARGLRLIGATTHDEFKVKIASDPALARRFDTVNVAEPDEAATVAILRARLPRLEAHHGVRVAPAMLPRIVRLADEYFPDRRRPDKALLLLDRAMAAQSIKSGV